MLDLLIFQLGSHDCALPAGIVRGIVHMAELARLPGQPSLIEGFLNLRGLAVPVVRMNRLFDLPPLEPGLYTPLILVPGAAYLVDRVLEVASVPEGRLLAIDENHTFQACTRYRAELDGRTVHVLSPDRLLLEAERRSLEEFQSRAQRYIDELEARER